jgi:hypothetical protein
VEFELTVQHPDTSAIHLVMEKLNIPRRKSLTDLLGEEISGEVLEPIYRPVYAYPRKLAESGRNRNGAPFTPVPGHMPDPGW